MVAKKVSPNRRRSIAVPNQNQPSIVPKNRRRAHSIVPGSLSPQSKARRSLVPRKSILKASINTFHLDSSSQQSTNDDGNATKSTDFTQDFTAPVHDNTSRKSLGRRVSFASHSHVRMFETIHTNSTGSPQSSPSSQIEDSPQASPAVEHEPTDENQYPGRNPRNRRSSVRYSMAQSEDMDLTTIAGNAFQNRGSAILDEEFDYEDDSYDEEEDEDGDNMDVTEAIKGGFSRKRSISMPRQPLQQLSVSENDEQAVDESRSDIGNDSIISDAPSEQSQAMEFTIPLGQSLRPPAEEDEAWVALKQLANTNSEPSGADESREEEEMELENAIDRLKRARDSLALPSNLMSQEEDSFMSTEDSFDAVNLDNGNKTLNLSQVIGRASMVSDSRLSLGQESNMDESEVYGNIAQARQSLAPSSTSVFQPPPSNPPPPSQPPSSNLPSSSSMTASSNTFSFVPPPTSAPRPTTPHKSPAKPKPTFSAAFAPPVTRASPKKPPADVESTPTQSKRLRPVPEETHPDSDLPSPAKRQALASKWQPEPPGSAALSKNAPVPKPLSPDRTAPFQQPASSLRRPSGYFARRKSLAVGSSSSQVQAATTQGHDTAAGTLTPTPKKKLPFLGLGRASMGAAPSVTSKPLNKKPLPPIRPKSPARQSSDKEAEAAHYVREASHQAFAMPSPTRGSPAPPRARVVEPEPEPTDIPAEAPLLVVEEDMGELSGEMEIDIDATQQWRDAVQAAEPAIDEEEMPSISINQFLSMTNIKFMDELTAPRKSTHPSQQPLRQPRNPSEIPMADYVVAMAINIPQLELYSRVSRDLEAWMAKSKTAFTEAEEEAAKLTPELFVEFARADEEGQQDLIHLLNLIKTNTRYQAKSDWYDWKLQWVEGLRATADEGFAQLENDAHALEDMKNSVDELVPQLEKEYADLMQQLEQEQAEVAEIESGDQEYLNDLKATIAEQNIEVEALKAELKDGKDQLRWLQEKSEEIEAQKREARSTIDAAQRLVHLKQTSTRTEVFRLKGELEALEKLHRTRIVKVDSRLFEYIYANRLKVTIPCRNFLPSVNKISISRIGQSHLRLKDDFPQLSKFLLSAAQTLIRESDDIVTVRQVVHRLSDYWSACTQLRSQLTLISIRYPMEMLLSPATPQSMPSFRARVMVMLPSCKGKAYISYVFNLDTFSRWPTTINTLDCDVEVAYGSISRETLLQAVMSRLSEATPTENFACLLDACIEAESIQPTS